MKIIIKIQNALHALESYYVWHILFYNEIVQCVKRGLFDKLPCAMP